jgi:hypothetical protein
MVDWKIKINRLSYNDVWNVIIDIIVIQAKTPYTLSKQELVSERKNNILNQQSILNDFFFLDK